MIFGMIGNFVAGLRNELYYMSCATVVVTKERNKKDNKSEMLTYTVHSMNENSSGKELI